MFANLELCDIGLVQTKLKPKHHRTRGACIPCRRSKRKCDGTKPICSRCYETGARECVWNEASQQSNPRTGSGTSSCRQVSTVTANTEPEPDPVGSSDILTTQWLASASSFLASASNIVFSQPKWHIPVKTRYAAEEMSELLTGFDRAVTRPLPNSQYKLLSQILPMSVEAPQLMHAVFACGFLLMSNKSPAWYPAAVTHYDKTVQAVSTSLKTDMYDEPADWILCSVLLLHTFEKFRSDGDSPSRMHQLGAHRIVELKFATGPPKSILARILLEAFLTLVATGGIADEAELVQYNYVEKLLELWKTGSCVSSKEPLWKQSSWMGVTHGLIDIVYKLAFLKRRVPLRGDDLVECLRLKNKLLSWDPYEERSISIAEGGKAATETAPLQMILSGKLFHAACTLLLEKILDPLLSSTDEKAKDILQVSIKVLVELRNARFHFVGSIWPLAILGTGAIMKDEKVVFKEFLNDMLANVGIGTVTKVLGLLSLAWRLDPLTRRSPGLDVLLDKQAMGCLFI